jgi:Trk-type K+ transport system membrane component
MMIRGRHRGLPYALDRAIVLPDEKSLGTQFVDDEDHEHHE